MRTFFLIFLSSSLAAGHWSLAVGAQDESQLTNHESRVKSL
jgi:hypothetical protein